jgi:enamine deaminase RidA (YjgF/YER057c/UK114 family)
MSGISLSQHCIHGDVVYTAGQVGREPDGTVPSGFARQMELAMASLGRQLEDAGLSLAQVLKATVFIVRREDFAEMSCSLGEAATRAQLQHGSAEHVQLGLTDLTGVMG